MGIENKKALICDVCGSVLLDKNNQPVFFTKNSLDSVLMKIYKYGQEKGWTYCSDIKENRSIDRWICPKCNILHDKNDKKRFYKVELAGGYSNYYFEEESGLSSIIDMLKDCDIGDGYTITVVEMKQDEYDSLSEFTGF